MSLTHAKQHCAPFCYASTLDGDCSSDSSTALIKFGKCTLNAQLPDMFFHIAIVVKIAHILRNHILPYYTNSSGHD